MRQTGIRTVPDREHEATHETAVEVERDFTHADTAHQQGDDAHPPHLAHHYDTPKQQYEASKFGMWLFLATELLFFGGLFVLYAVYRGKNPELFVYGAQFMSTKLGAINTVVLILSSLTMAFAVRYAQLGHKNALATMLGLTLLGGGIFMGIKYVEYDSKISKGMVWGLAFYDDPAGAVAPADAIDEPDAFLAAPAGDVEVGRQLWMATCYACHGDRGQGMPGQSFPLAESEFIPDASDQDLVDFIKRGRMPFDSANRTGIQMPPRGGNPTLNDAKLMDIVAFIRSTLEDLPAEPDAAGESADPAESQPAAPTAVFRPRSSVPPPAIGPRGLVDAHVYQDNPSNSGEYELLHPRHDPDRPENAHVFFGIYFLMTGVHGLHVLIGMGVIAWLLLASLRGSFSAGYYTPVELTGLFWHLVDLIWIFLFPMLYLIH